MIDEKFRLFSQTKRYGDGQFTQWRRVLFTRNIGDSCLETEVHLRMSLF